MYTTRQMEVIIARYFNARQNVPLFNISWGFNIHECDILIISKSRYLTEVEIKVSKGDLQKDSKKTHGHRDKRIKKMYYAVPVELRDFALGHIPEAAGLITVEKQGDYDHCEIAKEAAVNPEARRMNDKDMIKLLRLGAIRVPNLKKLILEQGGVK